jgi:hypothetical protein
MGGSFQRSAGLLIAGPAVLCLSFWITLSIIDGTDQPASDNDLARAPLRDDDGTPRTERASSLRDLPPAASGVGFGTAWDGIDGFNARVIGPPPIAGGILELSLVATRAFGRHRLGLTVAGVPENVPVQATAWVKVPPGSRISIDFQDGKPANSGAALFDPTAGKATLSSGNVKPSIEPGPNDWEKLTLRMMRSADGVLVIYVTLVGPSQSDRFSGEGQQIIFGGLEVAPS